MMAYSAAALTTGEYPSRSSVPLEPLAHVVDKIPVHNPPHERIPSNLERLRLPAPCRLAIHKPKPREPPKTTPRNPLDNSTRTRSKSVLRVPTAPFS